MDNSTSKKINKKSLIMQYAIKLLKEVIKDIQSGECSEEEVTELLAKINPENKGYFKEDDFVNYDEAGNMLHLGWNRNRLNHLCKVHKIENFKINNQKVGFKRKEILKLKQILVAK